MQWDFQQWLLIFLLLTLFFKEEMKSFVAGKLGLKTGVDSMQDTMGYLKTHYNDDLSEKLDHMDGKLDTMGGNISTINTRTSEWERFGTPPTRKT